MNPPYEGSLHLKILDNVINQKPHICINLSPIRWLQDPLALYKNGHDFDTFKPVRSFLESVDVINALDAQVAFNARISIDLGIYRITDYKLDKLFSLNSRLINKLVSFNNESPCPIEHNKKEGWRVRLPNVTCSSAANTKPKEVEIKTLICFDGLKDGKPWYTFFSKNQNTKETPEITCSVGFDTEQECINFTDSLRLDVIRYYTQKTIISVDYIKGLQVFWLGNTINPRTKLMGYKSDWANDDLINLFRLTETDIREIQTVLAKFN